MRRSFTSALVSAMASAAVALAGCSAGPNTHQSPPTAAEYDIAFPSTAAAVSVDTIQTFVFSTSVAKTDCPSLLVARENNTGLPTELAQTDPIALCDLLSGSKGEIPDVGYGGVAFLVVAQRQGEDYFSGCTQANLSATSDPISVQLEQVTIKPIPTTTCTSVSDHCASTCTVGDGG